MASRANLGPRERRKRIVFGAVNAIVAAGALAWMAASAIHPAWRLILFVPAWNAFAGLLQARLSTCVVLAWRGTRNMDPGEERVCDPDEAAQLRRQARWIHVWSVVGAAAFALAALLVPGRA